MFLCGLVVVGIFAVIQYRKDPLSMSAGATLIVASVVALLWPSLLKRDWQTLHVAALIGTIVSTVAFVVSLWQIKSANRYLIPSLILALLCCLIAFLFTSRTVLAAALKLKQVLGSRHPMLVFALIISIGAIVGGTLAWGWWRAVTSQPHERREISAHRLHSPPTSPPQSPTASTAQSVVSNGTDRPAPSTSTRIVTSPPLPQVAPPDETSAVGRREAKPPVAMPQAADLSALEKALAEHNRLESARLQPRFRFVLKEEWQEQSQSMLPDTLEIWNDGSEVQRFMILQYSFLAITRVTDANYEPTRYVPTYYFYDRHYTRLHSGLLLTMKISLSQFGYGSRNTRDEVNRLIAELKQELGPQTTLQLKVFIEIEYTDLTGVSHDVNYDVTPGFQWLGPTEAQPVGPLIT